MLKGKLYIHLIHILHDVIRSNIYMRDSIQAILGAGIILITFITMSVYMSLVQAHNK